MYLFCCYDVGQTILGEAPVSGKEYIMVVIGYCMVGNDVIEVYDMEEDFAEDANTNN